MTGAAGRGREAGGVTEVMVPGPGGGPLTWRCGSPPGKGADSGRVEHDVKEYPPAGHEFLNDHEGAGDKAPILFAVLGRLMPGAGYHARPRRRMRASSAFFSTDLRPGPAGPGDETRQEDTGT